MQNHCRDLRTFRTKGRRNLISFQSENFIFRILFVRDKEARNESREKIKKWLRSLHIDEMRMVSRVSNLVLSWFMSAFLKTYYIPSYYIIHLMKTEYI